MFDNSQLATLILLGAFLVWALTRRDVRGSMWAPETLDTTCGLSQPWKATDSDVRMVTPTLYKGRTGRGQ